MEELVDQPTAKATYGMYVVVYITLLYKLHFYSYFLFEVIYRCALFLVSLLEQ